MIFKRMMMAPREWSSYPDPNNWMKEIMSKQGVDICNQGLTTDRSHDQQNQPKVSPQTQGHNNDDIEKPYVLGDG